MNLNIPGYQVLERIGHGGMAEVYRARHLRLERDVALKVMLEQFSRDTTFCDRFVREARIAARLNHPNIVQIFDVDQHDKQLFLSMEYVDGGDLLEKRRQPLSYEQILNVLDQLTRALDYAHGQGYIHRDIKPANILFRRDGSLVISDFGIARAIHSDTNMTAAGSMVGTPNYMSPEQAKGQDLDGRADLYSVAVIAYQMLTGELPYVGDSTISIAIKHISEPIPILGGHLAPLQDFFNQALAKKANDRFATGAHMIAALRKELTDIPRTQTPAAIDDKTRLAPSSLHDKATKVSSPRVDATRETLLRPQADTTASREEPRQPTEVLHGDFISHAPASIRKVLRRINEITGIVVHPRRRKLTLVLSAALLGIAGFWLIQNLKQDTGILAGVGPASSDETHRTLTPEQQTRVNQLLENARQDIEAGRLSTPLGNNAYEKYLAVLAMAPRNGAAAEGLNTIVNHLLDSARAAMARGQWDASEQFLVQAKTVSPSHPDLDGIEQDLKAARQDRDQQLAQLFVTSEQAKKEGDTQQAVASLIHILALDKDNLTAKQELANLAQAHVDSARAAATQKHYADAEKYVASANNINATLNNASLASDILDLQNTIDSGQNRQQKQIRLNQYLQQAETAFNRGLYVDGDNNALANYRQALNIDNANQRAKQGIEKIKQALADRAQTALDDLRVDDAKQDLQRLRLIDARASQLAKLESALAVAEKQVAASSKRERQINELYERAERYLTAKRADGADKIYLRIERISPNHPGLPALGRKIADGYVFLAQNEIDGKDWDDVNVWVERGLKHVPDHKQLIAMRQYAEEQKKNGKRGLF